MREIKFRGKNIEDNWEYGSLVISNHGRLYEMIDTERRYRGEVNPATIGQFTGLKDRNMKKIYEGDIVKIGTYTKGVVEYSDKYVQFIIINTNAIEYEYEPLGDYTKIEIIGNKFDNPELLEEGE